LSYAGIYSIFL